MLKKDELKLEHVQILATRRIREIDPLASERGHEEFDLLS